MYPSGSWPGGECGPEASPFNSMVPGPKVCGAALGVDLICSEAGFALVASSRCVHSGPLLLRSAVFRLSPRLSPGGFAG